MMLTPPQNCSYIVAFRSHFIGKPSFKKNKVTADNILTKNLFVIKLNRKIDFRICDVFFKSYATSVF